MGRPKRSAKEEEFLRIRRNYTLDMSLDGLFAEEMLGNGIYR